MNPIMQMLSNRAGTSGMNNVMQQMMSRFGNINNAMKQLQGLMNMKGLSPEQYVKNNLQVSNISEDKIKEFKTFAKQAGMSESAIDSGLRQAGIIK